MGKDTIIGAKNLTDEQWIMLFHPSTETQKNELISAINELKIANANKNNANEIIQNGLILKINNPVKEVEQVIKAKIPQGVNFNISNIILQLENDEVQEDNDRYNPKYVFSPFQRNNLRWLINQVNYILDEMNSKQLFLQNKDKKDLLSELAKFSENDDECGLNINASKIGVADDTGKMVVDLVCNELLSDRIKQKSTDPTCKFKPIILFIDEVHRYALEKDTEGNYSSGLINIAREGRKYGIFLFLTSQSPKDVPPVVLNQIGTLLVHNLTGKDDLQTISNYFDEETLNSLSNLRRGQAILTGVNLIQDIQLNIKRSTLNQDNETPYIG